jgi:MFS family permease
MNRSAPSRRYWVHSLLFLVPMAAAGMWNVPFSNVLVAHGLGGYVAYGFACTALAAIAAPLIAGGLADQRVPSERLLRWLCGGTAVFLALVFVAIDRGWGAGAVLLFLALQSLCYTPIYSILSALVLAELADPSREFARSRVWGTVGWMTAGVVVSFVLRADTSTLSGYVAAGLLGTLALGLHWLPETRPPDLKPHRTWGEIFGVDALVLLRHHDHRVFFVVTFLYTVPLAAFYPYTPLQLRGLGVIQTTATLSLGQASEVVCMLWLGTVLARFRLKWIFLSAIGCAALRYGLLAVDHRWAVMAGVSLHGLCYTLFFITAQIYLAERIEMTMRSRAQALFFLISSGFGYLFGYLGSGWWKAVCTSANQTDWLRFWGGWSLAYVVLGVYFIASYHGVYRGLRRADVPPR